MKSIKLIIALFSMMNVAYCQTEQPELDSKFFSTFQGFLDNADGKKVNRDEGKILHQQCAEKSILITKKRRGTVWIEEVFDINWSIDEENTYLFLNVDDENKRLFRIEIGFLFDYNKYYYTKGEESKGELQTTNARFCFYILRTDLSELEDFLNSYNISHTSM